MCKDFVEIKDGKIIKIEGCFKKGHFVFCYELHEILKEPKLQPNKGVSLISIERSKNV